MRPKLAVPQSIFAFLLWSLLLPDMRTARAQTAPSPGFEVATVRPSPPASDPMTGAWSVPGNGRFTATHVPLTRLIELAYDINDTQIANKPGWLDTNLYDVDARPEDGIHLTRDELKPRLQNLLRERLHLVAHTEMRPARGYALVVAKAGAHPVPTKGDHFSGFRAAVYPGEMRGFNWTMPQLAKYLTAAAGFAVVDQTGISGSYDVAFSYNPKAEDTTSNLPGLDEALKEATGLMLKEQKDSVETVVIDSVDKVPTDN